MVAQESEATLRNMQTGDREQLLEGGGELGELDDEGDEEDEIVLEANNPRQSNRPQGKVYSWLDVFSLSSFLCKISSFFHSVAVVLPNITLSNIFRQPSKVISKTRHRKTPVLSYTTLVWFFFLAAEAGGRVFGSMGGGGLDSDEVRIGFLTFFTFLPKSRSTFFCPVLQLFAFWLNQRK